MDKKKQNKIRGALLGGAAGDALGYPVEFLSFSEIKTRYGEKGITVYEKTNGKALISDDTQMTLFTANGLLVCDAMNRIPGNKVSPEMFVPLSYQDWLKTQTYSYEGTPERGTEDGGNGISWLLDIPELYSRRAPGNTCLSALRANGREIRDDYLTERINDSKGSGGIMRIAPLGLRYSSDIKRLDLLGAEIGAITHGHSLGFMPCAVITHILNRIVYPVNGQSSLKTIVFEARDTVREIFAGDEHIGELIGLIDKAASFAENDEADEKNIKLLGEGWVAEETLAIALYCALKYEHNFSAGITAAVNHDGDSDSAGAVTGNILGAVSGYEAIGEKWKNGLELHDIILEIADDLSSADKKSPDGEVFPPDFECKYLRMRRKEYMDMLQFG